ncbi:MAG: DUF3253 domain-containing protein [Micrococcus sp.]|nr:DUF3253 domain-containing protein [Micrococcus sp.]
MSGTQPGPERTADGRYIIVKGRRWRAQDPHIPENLAAQLVSELMAARRAVKTDADAARPRVQDAKVALGERGDPWWESTGAGRRERLAAALRTLLRGRDAEATVCPSEAARVVGGEDWRERMDEARDVAARLHDQGQLEIRQRGERVADPRAVRGPIRVGRGVEFPHPPPVSGS